MSHGTAPKGDLIKHVLSLVDQEGRTEALRSTDMSISIPAARHRA